MLTIIVTGATGNVGRPLVTLLAEAGVHVRAVTREPRAAALPAGVELCPSVGDAMPGAWGLFLNSRALPGDALATTVEAAVAAGVTRLVALSSINADDDDATQPSRVRGDRNREVDELVRASGVEWISLRPSIFTTNFSGMWGPQLAVGDVVSGPYATAATAPIAPADIAAVAARALLDDALVGRQIPLTGPQSLTNVEALAVLGTVLHRALEYREQSPAQVRERFAAIGFPPAFADAYLGMLAPTVTRPAVVTDDYELITGRRATSFAQWASEHHARFAKH